MDSNIPIQCRISKLNYCYILFIDSCINCSNVKHIHIPDMYFLSTGVACPFINMYLFFILLLYK